MANTNIKVRQTILPLDTTPIDILAGHETRIPTGCMIKVINSDATDSGEDPTVDADFSICLGVSDFSTVATVAAIQRDGVVPTGPGSAHQDQSGNIIEFIQPGEPGFASRTATAVAIPGGITLTPGQSGADYIIQVTLIFGAEVKAFSIGGVVPQNTNVPVAHGLSGKPGCGFIYAIAQYRGSGTNYRLSAGLFSDDNNLIQHSNYQQSLPGGNATNLRGEISTTRISQVLSISGSKVFYNWEITNNDGVDTTFTVREDDAQSAGVIGLLLYMEDVVANVQILDTPTIANVPWSHLTCGFVPQYMCGLPSMLRNVNVIEAGPQASNFSIMESDNSDTEGEKITATAYVGNSAQASPPDTSSRPSVNILLCNEIGRTLLEARNPDFVDGGFIIAPTNILSVDSVARKMVTLFIQETASITPAATLSSPDATAIGSAEASGAVDTDTLNGVIYGVMTQNITAPTHEQIRSGQDHLGAPADSFSTRQARIDATDELNFLGLQEDIEYFAHYTQESSGGTPAVAVASATPVTTAVNQNPIIVSQIPPQVVQIGAAFSLNVSPNFDDPDGDTLSYDIVNQPIGLGINSVSGVISGVPTGGGSNPTNIINITFNFNSVENIDDNGLSALDSDNWPICWLFNDDQMTSFGDGMGFGNLSGFENTRGSFGMTRIEGSENNWAAFDVFKSGENMPTSEQGKCYGMIGANGKVYAAVDYFLVGGSGSRDDRFLGLSVISSNNLGASWNEEIRWDSGDWGAGNLNGFFSMAFIQYQLDNSGLRSPLTSDTYIYAIIMENEDNIYNVQDPGGIGLMRVLETDIESGNKNDWEYLSGIDGSNNPSWSSNINSRISHFIGQGGNDSSSIHYNEPLGRYILTAFHNRRETGSSNSDCFIGFYDAAEPWGPWHTILRTNVQTLGLANGPNVIYWDHSNKWLSSNGLNGVLVGTLLGKDEFGIIKYTLTVGSLI